MSTHPDYAHLEYQADLGLSGDADEVGGDIE